MRQRLARVVIDRMPQPALRILVPHIGPHLIDLRFLNPLDHHAHLIRIQCVEEWLVHRGECRLFFFNVLITVVGLIFNTRAVSRMPLPLRLIGLGHMTVDTCGKQFLLILHMAFKAKKNSAEAPRLSKKSCSGNLALCRV